MKNSGVIIANDASKERLKAVIGNIHRLGMRLFAVRTFQFGFYDQDYELVAYNDGQL